MAMILIFELFKWVRLVTERISSLNVISIRPDM
jgi:hypothetical protein